ncbi:MAG TPA: hypothetical protein VFB38_07125 [Chthonomonadaceae bacterium]|nr:hypothetical protein [Chthonomonadaceae bacterium]
MLATVIDAVEITEKTRAALHFTARPFSKFGSTLNMGAAARLIANYYARIVVEVPLLKPTAEQRQALYTTWPLSGGAGQRPRRVGQDHGTVAMFVWERLSATRG